MNKISVPDTVHDERLEWAEPEIQELHIRETSQSPFTGTDGGGLDCSHS